MSYHPITIQLKQDEYIKWKKLHAKDKTITQVSVFRRGLQEFVQDEVKDLTQSNVA